MYVLFDLDDTLIQTTFYLTEPRLKKAMDYLFSIGFKGKSFLHLHHLNQTASSADAALKRFFSPIEGNRKFYQQAKAIVYDQISADEVIEPFEGVIATLEKLRQNHHLFLVTYGIKAIQYQKLEKAGIESTLFSNITVTKNKDKGPSYQKIFDNLDCSAKEIFVVGDRFDRDLKPAKELGLTVVLITSGRSQKSDYKRADFVINNINQLVDIIA